MRDRPTLTLAHSPDSDDLVMWWPLTGLPGAGGKPAIDTGPFAFRCIIDDVQRLNRRAIERGDLDVTAISAATYPCVADRYAITASGGSFGEGYGPKLVVRAGDRWNGPRDAATLSIAVPGKNTTAFLVLSLVLGPDTFRPTEMLFSNIPGAVARGEFDAGLLIHEAQLTYESLGLVAVADLGVWWRDRTPQPHFFAVVGPAPGLPLPLGLNVIRRDLDERFGPGTLQQASRILGASIRHALDHPEASREYLRSRSADRPEWRDPALLDRYLAMYVSDLTLDMGDRGRAALRRLFADAHAAGLCPDPGPIDTI